MFARSAAKSKRRSPIKAPPLRAPGQSIRDEMLDTLFDRWLPCVMFPAVGWILAMIDWLRLLGHAPLSFKSCIVTTVLATVITVVAVLRGRKVMAHLRNLRQGMDGEVAVGQFLDEYCRGRGYKVLHDLKGNDFNVDHVLIGKGGVFALETKTISKPTLGEPVVTYEAETVLVDGFTPDRNPVTQAKACARHVAELLSDSTNRDLKTIFVRPVVLYPGWFIKGSSSGREVWVLNPKSLVAFLDHEDIRLSNEDVGLFHSHLKTRNRGG